MEIRLPDEPPGWRDLTDELQQTTDPARFQTLLTRIYELLAAHEARARLDDERKSDS